MIETLESRELMKSLSFSVIDLETTGGNHNSDKIIEIGIVKIKDLEIIDSKNYLIDPEIPIPEFIQKLTSIKESTIRGKPKIEDVITEIVEYISDDIIVAHNSAFDFPFLNSVLDRMDYPKLENKVICTNIMTKYLIPEITNSNLNYLSQLFNISHKNAHRASDDAEATAKLLLKFIDIYISKGIKKVNQLYYPKNKFELDRMNFDDSDDQKKILSIIEDNNCPMTITLKGDRGLILGVLPIEEPSRSLSEIQKFINIKDYKVLTLKLNRTLIDGIVEFNSHFNKYDDSHRLFTLEYLQNYLKDYEKDKVDTAKLDIIFTHHLVQDQLIVYNLMNFNSTSRGVFKFPAQKKKMMNFITQQINRFENNHKGRRKTILHSEVNQLLALYVTKKLKDKDLMILSKKDAKGDPQNTFSRLEGFRRDNKFSYNFPTKSL